MMLHNLISAAGVSGTEGRAWEFVRGLLLLIVFLLFVLGVGWYALKRTEDPALLVFKWVISVFMGWVTLFKVGPYVLQNPFVGVPLTAACGIVFAIIWRESIIGFISKPFTALYDGGESEVEPRPFYSVAQAKRKRGHYFEAISEIRMQLERFPQDFEGQFMIAEILAENMNDVPGAEVAIQRLCHQKSHPAGSIVMALNALADWHMKYGQDAEAARQALERIGELFPESEAAALASQRIAHLAGTEQMLSAHDPKRIPLRPGVQDIGLLETGQQPKAPDVNPEDLARDYVKHLEAHPLDTEAREKLATIYAEHYGRLDLAATELEQLIGHEGQPASRVAHWLNLLADLQLQYGSDYDTVRATLQRIVDRNPAAAAAELARSRISHLKLEFRKKEKSQTVKLGSYEQDIGLKSKREREPGT